MALRFSHAADADPAAALVEHAECLGLQAVQAVWDLRPFELRCTRGRADSPDLAADDHADLRPDRPGHRPGGRQADLRPSRARRSVHRPQASRHRRGHERPDPGRAPGRSRQRPSRSFRPQPPLNVEPLLKPHLPLGSALAESRPAREEAG